MISGFSPRFRLCQKHIKCFQRKGPERIIFLERNWCLDAVKSYSVGLRGKSHWPLWCLGMHLGGWGQRICMLNTPPCSLRPRVVLKHMQVWECWFKNCDACFFSLCPLSTAWCLKWPLRHFTLLLSQRDSFRTKSKARRESETPLLGTKWLDL